jgi:hypothetical protein
MDNIQGLFYLNLGDGSRRAMRVTIGLAERIEIHIMKRPLIRLLKEAISGEFNVSDLYRFFYEAICEGKDTRLNLNSLGEKILLAGGAANFLGLYTEMLTYALTGGVTSESQTDDDKKK